MAMDNERELNRLAEMYDENTDDELLHMYARRDDLTELAQQALSNVMRERKLSPGAKQEEPIPGIEAEEEDPDIGDDEEPLWRFTDAFQAQSAIRAMDDAGIEYRMLDRSSSRWVGNGNEYLPGLQMVVFSRDVERAQDLLREKIGLFPLPEFDDVTADLAGWTQLGEFSRADALAMAKALGESGWSYVWDDDASGLGTTANVMISVKDTEHRKATKAIERGLGKMPVPINE